MDDVLGQLVILLNLLLIAILMWPMCRDSWRDKESHNIRGHRDGAGDHSSGADGADGNGLLLHHAAPVRALD